MTIDELLAQIAQLQTQLQSLQTPAALPQEQITTGPNLIKGSQPTGAMPLWQQIKEDKDPKAVALLELKQDIKDQITALKEESKKFRADINEHQKALRKTDSFLITITIVVVVAFVTTSSLVFFDLIKEKDLYLRYNDLYQKYSDENMRLKDEINDQKIDFNNLKNELQSLKDRNFYLK